MARGRKPAPKAIKLLKGSQKCRINDEEPATIAPVVAEPPVELDEVGRAEWDRMFPSLGRMKVLSESDLSALALYCSAWSQWRRAEAEVRARGLVAMTPMGPKVNPMVRVAEKAREQCLRFLAEFGCTPSSRGRLKIEKEPPRDKFAEFMARKNT